MRPYSNGFCPQCRGELRSPKRYIIKAQVPNMKVRDVIRLLEQDGWYLSRTRGSHRQFKHSLKSGLVTVPGKPSDDLAIKTLRSIFKQAQLNKYLEEGDNN